VPDIFSTARGSVVAVDGPGVTVRVALEGWQGYNGFKAVITGVNLETENGTQFLHTLRDFIYVYTFGERVGQMTIQGVTFAVACGDDAGEASYHGLEYAYAYYLRARASELTRPVTVTLGGDTTFFAFVVGMRADLDDTESTMGRFSLVLKTVPLANRLVPQV